MHGKCKWVQEGFFANFGDFVTDQLSPPAVERIGELDANSYYRVMCHDGRSLSVPANLDDMILSKQHLAWRASICHGVITEDPVGKGYG